MNKNKNITINKKFFEFIPETSITEDDDEILLYPITSENIDYRLGNKLDKKYLYRVHMALCCIEEIRENLNKVVNEAVNIALDDEEEFCKEIDKKYEEGFIENKNKQLISREVLEKLLIQEKQVMSEKIKRGIANKKLLQQNKNYEK